MAPSIWEFCTAPELPKVQEIFSTMSKKISSRTLPSVLEVSRMDLMTPVGPLPTPENSELPPPLCGQELTLLRHAPEVCFSCLSWLQK